jgi:hypothetical protein
LQIPESEPEAKDYEGPIEVVTDRQIVATQARAHRKATARRLVAEEKEKERSGRRRLRRRSRSTEPWWYRFRVAVHPSILSGGTMMIVAVIWFVVGLATGYFYFYPPALFVIGLFAVIGGFRGTE